MSATPNVKSNHYDDVGSDSSDDDQQLHDMKTPSKDRSNAMVFDRTLVGDRNGLKTSIIKAVFENQIHLQARKGEAFDLLAEKLSQTDEFRHYRLHGRKLQKSFNKIARDIKDCIVAGNEPSRWGKEEPEFFKVAKKIFDEARRAGIRAFDEKLKSKSMEDRLTECGDESAKKRKKRDYEMSMGVVPTDDQVGYPQAPLLEAAEWTKAVDEYVFQKLQALRNAEPPVVKLTKDELEMQLRQAVDQLHAVNVITINDLITQAGVSGAGKQKITENCGFSGNDDVMIFLLTYSDAIAKDAHPVSSIRDQFDNLSSRDASVLYNFIGKMTKH